MGTKSRNHVEYNNGNDDASQNIHKNTTVVTLKDMFTGSSTNFLIATTFSLLLLQFYFKVLSRKKKGECAKLESGAERIYGLNDIQTIKPFLPIKLIGNIPHFLPVKGKMVTHNN